MSSPIPSGPQPNRDPAKALETSGQRKFRVLSEKVDKFKKSMEGLEPGENSGRTKNTAVRDAAREVANLTNSDDYLEAIKAVDSSEAAKLSEKIKAISKRFTEVDKAGGFSGGFKRNHFGSATRRDSDAALKKMERVIGESCDKLLSEYGQLLREGKHDEAEARLQDATKAAISIVDPLVRFSKFCKISRLTYNSDQLLQLRMDILNQTPDQEHRSKMIEMLCVEFIRKKQSEVVIEAANDLSNVSAKSEVLYSLCFNLIENKSYENAENALVAAKAIPDLKMRARALFRFMDNLPHWNREKVLEEILRIAKDSSDPSDLIQLAQGIQDPEFKSRVLHQLFSTFIMNKRLNSDQILSSARALPDNLTKTTALLYCYGKNSLSEGKLNELLKIGQNPNSLKEPGVPSKLINLACEIPDPGKSTMIDLLFTKFLEKGMRAEAKMAAQEINDYTGKATALLVLGLYETRYLDDAKEVREQPFSFTMVEYANRLFTLASKIPNLENRSEALYNICCASKSLFGHPSFRVAQKNYEFSVANAIDDGTWKRKAFEHLGYENPSQKPHASPPSGEAGEAPPARKQMLNEETWKAFLEGTLAKDANGEVAISNDNNVNLADQEKENLYTHFKSLVLRKASLNEFLNLVSNKETKLEIMRAVHPDKQKRKPLDPIEGESLEARRKREAIEASQDAKQKAEATSLFSILSKLNDYL